MPRDIRFNSGFVGCDDKCAIMRHELVPRRLKEHPRIEEIGAEDITDGMYVYVDNDGEDCKANLSDIIWPEQVRSDGEEDNPKKPAYIENKPIIGDTFVKETFKSTVKVGGVEMDDLILKGTPWAEVVKKILTGITGEAKLYWWVTANDPKLETFSIDDFGVGGNKDKELCVRHYSGFKTISRSELLRNGFEGPKYLGAHSYELNNEGQVLAISYDAQLEADGLEQEGFIISRREGFEMRKDDEYIYFYLTNASTGVFTCKYHFIDYSEDLLGGLYFGITHKQPRWIHDLDHLQYFPNLSRSQLITEGGDSEGTILDDSEGGPPYAYWFTELGSEGDSEGLKYNGYNVIAINNSMKLKCTGVTQVTTASDATEGFIPGTEPVGQWTFYFFEQKTKGHFKGHYSFEEVR